jgi:nicotinate phosphoribosyltransferase
LEANLGLDRAPLDAFAELGFSGDVWAVPEGRVVVAGEPLLEVTTPIAQARLVETALLNEVTFQTAATSNVQAARRFGLPVAGTMAHSFIEAFEDERAAFRAFAGEFPDRATFLVDTYDTLGGVRAAIEVIGQLGLRERLGIRIDSGDLAEQAIADLVARRTPIDAYGVGTKVGTSADAPYLDTAYKLVAYGGRPVMKLSPGKITAPGPSRSFVASSPKATSSGSGMSRCHRA